jgi:hypothetical protein
MISSSLYTIAFLCLIASPILAHSVWIAPLADGQLSLRFGEWGADPETSPGHLDSLIGPTAINLKGGEPAPYQLAKKADHYLLAGASAQDSVIARSDYGVMERGGESRRPIFYARWWPVSRSAVDFPVTTLDLLPRGGASPLVEVNFKGKAVGAGVTVTFYPPGAESVKLVTDAAGQIRLPEVTAPGLCMLYLGRYSDPTPGEFRGKAYTIASHSATLCWNVVK